MFSDFSLDLADKLQRFYVQSQEQELPKLLLEAPPQHGKSRVAAELFPAWLLGINPNLKIVVATYAFNLAKKRNFNIQRIFESPIYKQLFPASKLRVGNDLVQGERTAEGFSIVSERDGTKFEGAIRFTGLEGSLTGYSADIGIIDDPYKDMASARSRVQNEKTIEWYNSVFKTRLSKRSGVLMMLTRWTINDLAGQCSKEGDWTEIKYQAISKEGKALVPPLFPIKLLLKRREETSTAIWEAMYQQNPITQGGNLIKEDWLQYYSTIPQKLDRIFITGDTALKATEHADYSVFSVWGKVDNKLYWLDMWRGKVEAPGLKEAANKIWDKWKAGIGETPANAFYIEDKASGTGLIQELKRSSSIPILALPRTRDKYSRLMDVINYIESERLYLPDNAVWTKSAVEEMLAFSGDLKHQHDDIVDTLLDGLSITFVTRRLTRMDVL